MKHSEYIGKSFPDIVTTAPFRSHTRCLAPFTLRVVGIDEIACCKRASWRDADKISQLVCKVCNEIMYLWGTCCHRKRRLGALPKCVKTKPLPPARATAPGSQADHFFKSEMRTRRRGKIPGQRLRRDFEDTVRMRRRSGQTIVCATTSYTRLATFRYDERCRYQS